MELLKRHKSNGQDVDLKKPKSKYLRTPCTKLQKTLTYKCQIGINKIKMN
jgi:hypothetical protein